MESPEQRQACLEQFSLNQQQRLALESPEQRQAHLEQFSLNRQQMLALETSEQRQVRLEQLSLKTDLPVVYFHSDLSMACYVTVHA